MSEERAGGELGVGTGAQQRRPTRPDGERTPASGPRALDIDLGVPERDVQLRLRAAAGRITALIGPNGAGKSTLLGALAGTVGARGHLLLGETDLARRPAHLRGLGHLQQDAGLFAHLSVLENVAFGPRAQGARRGPARDRARAMLRAVEADDLVARRPRHLSGGQAQRVAIARALATDPAVMLLDEPFAALDAEVTARLRTVLGRMLTGRTALLVTHDLLDVLALADDVAVLEGGRIIAHGTREEILSRPPTVFAARLTGRFLVPGVLQEAAGDADGSSAEILTADGRRIPGRVDPGCETGTAVHALVDPSRVRLEPAAAGEAGTVPIESVDRLGSHVLVHAGGIGAEVEAARALGMDLRPGTPVQLQVDPGSTVIYRLPEPPR